MEPLSGSKRISEALKNYGISTFEDVIFHLPRRYLTQEYADEMSMNTNDKVLLLLRLIELPRAFETKIKKITIIKFKGVSAKGFVYNLTAYNSKYLLSLLSFVDMEFSVYGTINLSNNEIKVSKIYPRVIKPEEHVIPVYSLPGEVANFEFARIVKKALQKVKIPTMVPDYLNAKHNLLSQQNALNNVHFPFSLNDVFRGLQALKYQEGLSYFTSLAWERQTSGKLTNTRKKIIDLKQVNDFIKSLDFVLSKDQIKVVREIGNDMNKPELMYRLLQGDVGSGKTIVSFIALYINYLRGATGVLLAPTESLAKQHYNNLLSTFKKYDLTIALLTGSLTSKEKRELKQSIELGNINIIVGTHALFSEDVIYPNLSFVVIDEQQKFGINQRRSLLNKGEKADLLLMSATPIPHTLASIVFGGDDISTINEFPFRKRDVETVIVSNKRSIIFKEVDETLSKKKQVYIIAPKISRGIKTSVEKLYEIFKNRYGESVVQLHGKLSSEEKEKALTSFNEGKTPLLVGTSVVEVGIDVKNASLMVIFEPSSFGLSSLHQLRGRIGRDGTKAKLLLVNDEEEYVEKLEAFARENDGFKIAELDLMLRGPGELIGEKQSGFTSFTYLNIIKDMEMIKVIKNDVDYILSHQEEVENKTFLLTLQTK